MAKLRDRMEDFKDAVRQAAISSGYNESKLAAVMAKFIIHPPRQRSPFTRAAYKTLESIGALEQFMLKHRKDYVDRHRTTEHERDSIEQEVSAFIKVCQEQISVLKNSINDDEAKSKGWLGIRADHSNADTIAHTHGVVLILSERLHSVTSQYDQLRSIRFQDTFSRATPRRKLNRIPKKESKDTSSSNSLEVREPEAYQAQSQTVQQQLLDDETRALQVELTSLLDAVQETETKMVEMSALNHLMSTHVLQQREQIEQLYERAVEATHNVDLGNKELSKAIQRNTSSRTFLLLFLFVLTFSILFLDCLVFQAATTTHLLNPSFRPRFIIFASSRIPDNMRTMAAGTTSQLSCFSAMNRHLHISRRPSLLRTSTLHPKSLSSLAMNLASSSKTRICASYTGDASLAKSNPILDDEQVGPPKRAAKIHDFCFGIPFGGMVLSGGLLGFFFLQKSCHTGHWRHVWRGTSSP
ncbi:hypothetical protein ACLB2K_074113 [Fragaria x ananassa]